MRLIALAVTICTALAAAPALAANGNTPPDSHACPPGFVWSDAAKACVASKSDSGPHN